ncbi:hypothetical protein [Bradyrhizobium sp.]|jgi:uncharacterized integral membrane protein|uniref:hypothetical protein n=1 Tax=Bradyrhizobium sp. TaxID=376 RepID=UPI002DDCFBFF|nr:hypothetical protein [Bradyrhizobium sp.]HEV2154758.1 hypothetical protein [Bradyrhizobium sp.]
MYLLTAGLIVLALTALVASRRAGRLPRTRQGRFAAIWPVFCSGILALGLLAIWRAQDVQDVGSSVTLDLLMLVVAFNAGWFIGVFGVLSWD